MIFLEPIALYHTTDLHAPEDGAWSAAYSAPSEGTEITFGALGQIGSGTELAIITYGNGLYLSRQAAPELEALGIKLRIIDLRWLHPLNADAIVAAVADCANILIVDESRRSGSLSEKLMTILTEAGRGSAVSRITAEDCFIPLGPAAELVLPSKQSILEAAKAAVA